MAVGFSNYSGRAPNVQTDTLTAAVETVVISMIFNNTDTVARNLKIWLKNGVNYYKLFDVNLNSNDTFVVDTKYVLEAGQSVALQADAASVIDYVMSYSEMT